MDYADKAADAETKHRNLSLEALKRRAVRHNLGDGPKDCLECGEEIPKKRREALPGCELCVRCQAEQENT